MADKNLNSITFPGLPDKYKVAQVADEYSSSSTYAVGDIVNYLGTIYRCTTAITTAENWTAGHWTAIKIADEITDLKSALNKKAWDIGSYNRFNKDTVTSGKVITKAGVLVDNADYTCSDFIPVTSGTVMYYYGIRPGFFTFYNEDKEVISTTNTPNLTLPFTVPANVCYMRVTLNNNYLSSAFLSIIDKFDTFKNINNYVWDNFDDVDEILNYYVAWIEGKFINPVGNLVTNANYKATDFIAFNTDTISFKIKYDLLISANTKIAFYDINKTFISSEGTESESNVVVTGIINPPQNAVYVRFSSQKDYDSKLYVIGIEGKIAFENKIVSTSQIENNAITTSKINDDAVTTNKLANGAVTTNKLGLVNHVGNYLYGNEWIENTYINASGVPTTFNGLFATGRVFLDANEEYYWANMYGGYCAFYDENDNVLEGHGTTGSATALTNPFTTPANTKYGRFTAVSVEQTQSAWISTENAEPVNNGFLFDNDIYINSSNVIDENSDEHPCDYKGDEISVFNKIICIGDSLTSGTFNYRVGDSTGHYVENAKYSYPTYLEKITGCETVNKGNGGLSSAEWYAYHQNDDLSGFDCAIIQLGVNDTIRYTTFGETSQTAFTNIINKLKTENNNIKIFVANIIPATSYSNTTFVEFSNDLLAWINTTYANDINVIPLDMQQYGNTKKSSTYNCGHLSALGYRRLAQDYKSYISWYIDKNKDVFKEVQFIGTDYYYDPI